MVAHGESYVQPGVEDVVFCFMRFPSGLAAHLHLSWLDPHKERRFTVVGSRRMATFDDMELERKLTIYDKGFDEDARGYGEYITRSGDIFSPRIANVEPLRAECEHFSWSASLTGDARRAPTGCQPACAWSACSRRWRARWRRRGARAEFMAVEPKSGSRLRWTSAPSSPPAAEIGRRRRAGRSLPRRP